MVGLLPGMSEAFRQLRAYVGRILKWAKPSPFGLERHAAAVAASINFHGSFPWNSANRDECNAAQCRLARLIASDRAPTKTRLKAQVASRLNQLRDTNIRPKERETRNAKNPQ